MIIATANAVSAAATAMMNMEKKTPSNKVGYRYLFITTKFTTDAFKINSVEMRIDIKFFLVMKPYTPIKKMMEVTVKISYMLIPAIIKHYFLSNNLVPLAITIAPTIAASNNTLITSKGNTNPPFS